METPESNRLNKKVAIDLFVMILLIPKKRILAKVPIITLYANILMTLATSEKSTMTFV